MAREATPQLLDPRRIELLRVVDEEGTISAAALALNFSCSGLSQQLRQLEAQLGTQLVERSPRAATLTAAGRRLLEHSSFVLDRLRQAELEVREVAQLRGGRLRIATFRSVGETLVAEAVAYFRGRWPGVDVSLREGEPEDYLHLLRADELDLAMAFEYDGLAVRPDDRLALTLLCEEEMVLVVPAGHRLAGCERIPLRGLAGERWVASTPRSVTADFTDRACAAAGYRPDIALRSDDYRVVQALVAESGGVAFLPFLATRSLRPGLVARRVADLRFHRRIFAAHRTGGERAPAVAAMLEVLREVSSDVD